MNRLALKRKRIETRVRRVRHAIASRNPRPRLVYNRTNQYIYAQIVDDKTGAVLAVASSKEKNFEGPRKNLEAAKKVGELVAERGLSKGVKSVVLDRRGWLYHGRVAAFADAAREKGLEF